MAVLASIGGWFKQLGSSIAGMLGSVEEREIGILKTVFAIEDDLKSAVAQLKGFKTFKFDPKFKTRVINVPRAYEGIQDLLDIVIHGLRDKFTELRDSVVTLGHTLESTGGRLTDNEGPSAVANVASKFAAIAVALESFQESFHTALEFEEMLLDIKTRLESLEDLFLPQDKPRKWVTEKLRKRV